jgi:hypothetical protein
MTAESRNAVMIVFRVMVTVGAPLESNTDNARQEPWPPRCAATTYVIDAGWVTAVSAVNARNAQTGQKAKPLPSNSRRAGDAPIKPPVRL